MARMRPVPGITVPTESDHSMAEDYEAFPRISSDAIRLLWFYDYYDMILSGMLVHDGKCVERFDDKPLIRMCDAHVCPAHMSRTRTDSDGELPLAKA
jgi:hypothetical protein